MIANTPSAKEKTKALDLALQQIEKQFGKGSIMKLGEESARVAVEVIPTGSIGLDLALGVGGVPRGRIVEIYGPESSGKTTLALTITANAQRLGGNAVFIDAEHALDAAYAQKLGVDIANLHVAQPDTGEEALEITDHLVRSGAVDVVVIDSVAALVPRAEIEGEMGDSHVGLQARLMSQALRKLTGSISKSKTCVIFINQIRMQIGVMFGSPETTAGGRALKFYASVRMDIRRIATLKEGDSAIGNRTKVKVVKNKIAAPFREAEFDILYNEGISREGELVDYAAEKGVITKAGTWFSFGEERIGQGRENARLFVKEHADIRAQIEAKLMPALGLRAPETAREVPASEGSPPARTTPAAPSPRSPAMVASGDRKR
jgi:recombination protein RecA